jgi:flagellar hook-associated protein 3 FlgL
MRVTVGMRDASARLAATKSSEQVLEASKRASSGKRVSAPKDDPTAYSRVASQTGDIGVLVSRQRSIARAEGELAAAESALASAADILSRAREIAVQMANGDISALQRSAAANEVTQLRQTLVGIGNTKVGEVYVFSGTATSTEPFDTAGNFLGNDGAVSIELADGIRVRANSSGEQALKSPTGRDVFADLDALATALTTNNVGSIQTSIGNIDTGHKQVTKVRGDAGVTVDRMRTATTISRSAEAVLRGTRADEDEAEAVEAFSDLQQAQAAYDRALEVTRRMLSLFQIDKIAP